VNESDLKRLEEAVRLLENPGWIAKLTQLIGMPIDWAIRKLPEGASSTITKATEKAVTKALEVAVSTMDRKYRGKPFKWSHRVAVVTSGGAGGFFGLPGLAIELPLSTVIMLRAIADTARSEGENIGTIDAQLACVQVFALGGSKRIDDASETGYYAARIALSRALTEAGEFIAEKGFAEEGAPVIVRLVAGIASRFGVVVSEKAAAEAVPILGAAGGAAINLLFINHFQSMAHGHFIVRSLERHWGEEVVKKEYERIAKEKYRSAHHLLQIVRGL
jgi:hypothetical protein